MKIFYTLVLAIALMALLRGAGYFLNLATRKSNVHKYTLRIFPWLEVALWMAYLFWVIHYWFYNAASYHLLFASVAIVIIVLLGWYVLREIISGAVFRSDNRLEPGLQIKTDSIAGSISGLGIMSMEIISAEGEKITVPYSQITGQSMTQKATKGQGKIQVFTITIPQHYGAVNIERRLKHKLLECSWVIAEGDIKIKMDLRDQQYEVEVSYYSIKDDMLNQTEEMLREYINETLPPKSV
ncbi:MAG: mechanosensitive ion channel domain-containing protein [bacterium]